MGITYLRDGEVCKGSDIGASWAVVNDRVSVTADDLPLMKATNIKSQEQPARLSQVDSPEGTLCERAMFDRAVEMAVLKLGQGKKFKNSRADISSLRISRPRAMAVPFDVMYTLIECATCLVNSMLLVVNRI